jgi:hypothetical protein
VCRHPGLRILTIDLQGGFRRPSPWWRPDAEDYFYFERRSLPLPEESDTQENDWGANGDTSSHDSSALGRRRPRHPDWPVVEFNDVISYGRVSIVYRAAMFGVLVAIKVARGCWLESDEDPDTSPNDSLRQEYKFYEENLKTLQGLCVPKVYGYFVGGMDALVLEHFDGSLSDVFRNRPTGDTGDLTEEDKCVWSSPHAAFLTVPEESRYERPMKTFTMLALLIWIFVPPTSYIQAPERHVDGASQISIWHQ